MPASIVVIDTGTSNNASMVAALNTAANGRATVSISNHASTIKEAELVVCPGVATFGNAMEALTKDLLVDVLIERVKNDRPTLFVCVGLQILAALSAESPNVRGLEIFPGALVSKIPEGEGILVPQQGWNLVQRDIGKRTAYRFLTDGHCYFSNSFALTSAPLGGWNAALTTHGIDFVAALEKGNILACQFHPELSGEVGQKILNRWISLSLEVSRQEAPQAPLRTNHTRRVIPCLDVRGGRVVKGVSFQGLRDAGDPVELAKEYERQGADELVMLDISATPDERSTSVQTVEALCAATLLPLCVGGGIRSVETAQKILNAGADKVAINTAAVTRPELISELSSTVGRQCTVLAIDAKRSLKTGGWEVVVKSGKEMTGLDVVEWAQKGVSLGAGEILLTSFDEDGQGNGYDLELLAAVSGAVGVPVIASGGGRTAEHMIEALSSGADAVLAATIFHFGETTVGKLKSSIASAFQVRVPPALKKSVKTLERGAQTIIPSIDLMGEHAVQLVGGDPQALEVDAGDPLKLVQRFGIAGDVAIIDLDAALGKSGTSNAAVIESLIRTGVRCRVGGGIRSHSKALDLLNAGVSKIIIGTAATPEFCSKLPRDRVMISLDARHGEVVTHGWTTKTGKSVKDQMRELAPYCCGFLVTFVEREGRLAGCDFGAIQDLVDILAECDPPVTLTVAGGVSTTQDIARLDSMGVQAQVGMAIYKGLMDLGDAIAAPMRPDRSDGLVPTVVCDESGHALGLAYSSTESVRAAVRDCAGTYWSRSRNELWKKGLTSGDTQQLIRIDMDCDRDAFRFIVRPKSKKSGFCHVPTQATCFGPTSGLVKLEQTVFDRLANAPEGSYTKRLFNDAKLLESKLLEEAGELAEAEDPDHVAEEFADVLYFAMVKAASRGVGIAELEKCLDRRSLKVKRRKGDAKKGTVEKAIARGFLRKGSSSSSSSSFSSSTSGRQSGTLSRESAETNIQVSVGLDGTGKATVSTGIGFLDHMIAALAKHSSIDINLSAKGDLHVDDHHTAEDCGIMLGRAIKTALGDRKNICRWGYALCPLDEALSRAVVDVSGRGFAKVDLQLQRDMVGAISSEMLEHFILSLATAADLTVHVTVLEGRNDHHRSESAFKALAVAFKMAFAKSDGAGIKSTKNMLD